MQFLGVNVFKLHAHIVYNKSENDQDGGVTVKMFNCSVLSQDAEAFSLVSER